MNSLAHKTHTRIRERSAQVGVIGLGYVGLPLSRLFWEAGFSVVGVDVDPRKIRMLRDGQSYVEDVPSSAIQEMRTSSRFVPTTDYAALHPCDVVVIAVPTPLSKTKDPDLRYIEAALDQLIPHLREGQLVSLESTTYPGTTEEVIRPRLEQAGWRVGENLFLGFSPERINPGDRKHPVRTIPKVVGGTDPVSLELMKAFYASAFERVHPVSSATAAEMAKLLENTFRNVNIALINEVAQMCHLLGLDVWEVIEAAGTKPFGFMKFYPGPGIGGHCIPVDPHYLAWKMKTLNYSARMIQTATEINTHMPRYVVIRLTELMNDRGKSLKGSRFLILGVAYKKNVSDTRESPALDILLLLQARGAEVLYHDPYVPHLTIQEQTWHSVPLEDEVLAQVDAVLILTDHDNVDYDRVVQKAPLVFDTRNVRPRLSSDPPPDRYVRL